jgi:hypothetical protein
MAVVAAVLCLAVPALADTDHVSDPNDVAGQLDIEDIRQAHGGRASNLRHRITTFEGWDDDVLADGGRGYIEFIFSTGGDSCAEKRVVVKQSGGKLKAFIQDFDPICGDDSRAIGNPVRMRARIGRPDERTLVLSFDRSELGDLENDYYSWSARTKFKTKECSEARNGVCIDSGPDSGRGKRGVLAHDLS